MPNPSDVTPPASGHALTYEEVRAQAPRIPAGRFTCRQERHDDAWWRVESDDRSDDALSLVLVQSVRDSTPHCRLNGPLGGCRITSAAILRHEADRLQAAADILEGWEHEHADPFTHGRLV